MGEQKKFMLDGGWCEDPRLLPKDVKQINRVIDRIMPMVDAVLVDAQGVVLSAWRLQYSRRVIHYADGPTTFRWDGRELDQSGRRVFRRDTTQHA